MLATLVKDPFHRPGWVYEEKYDGDRILAYKEGERIRLLSRNAKDHTIRFGQITAAISALPSRTLLLDGEVLVFDHQGVSRFQLLQQGRGEPTYAVFDCLYRDGRGNELPAMQGLQLSRPSCEQRASLRYSGDAWAVSDCC